mgnify:FL=1
MPQTNINIRMDKKLKEQFDLFCSNVGMSMTTAFCIFAKKAVREQRIPFEITAEDPFYSEVNMERLKKAIEDLEKGKGKEHELIEVKDYWLKYGKMMRGKSTYIGKAKIKKLLNELILY